jgi:hypothetical protein
MFAYQFTQNGAVSVPLAILSSSPPLSHFLTHAIDTMEKKVAEMCVMSLVGFMLGC